MRIIQMLLLGCVLAANAPWAWGAGASTRPFQRDMIALTHFRSRIVGSKGYDAAGAYLESQIRAIPNVELRVHEYPVMVPVTQSATIDLGGGHSEPIYPFWPAHVRVCSTPPQGITGKLVYVGEARCDELRPASLKGQIAVVEASARQQWIEAANLGPRALLILGSSNTGWPELQSQDIRVPVNIPRFYIPPGALADDLRAGKVARGTLKATVTWEPRTARNFYALVRPDHVPSHDSPAALMFSVRYDASSLVPDLAPGASQAIQAAAGLRLLRAIAAHPWDRPVVVFFSGADSIQFLGTRNMLMALGDLPTKWGDEIASLEVESESAKRDLARARAIANNPASLSITDDRDLIARVIQIIETDQSLEQDELFRLRSQQAIQTTPEAKEQIKTFEARQVQLSRLKSDFQRKPADLAEPSVTSDARDVLHRVIVRLAGDDDSAGLLQQNAARKSQLDQRIALYHWLASATGRPLDPDESRTDCRLIDLLVGLDFSDRGSACGPMFFGNFQRISGMPQIQEFRDWFATLQRDFDHGAASAQWWRGLKSVVNLEPLAQRRLPPTYLAAPMAIPSELAQAWGVPGLSMITLDDLRLFRDTPNDTLDRIDLTRIIPQIDAVAELFRHATSDPDFRGPDELRRLTAAITGQVVSPAPGMPVPRLPRPGFLATYYYVASKDKKIPQLGSLPWTLGVRRDEVRPCDAEGRYRFEGLPRLRAQRLEGIEKQQADLQLLDVHVYRIDRASGAITATTDLGKAASDMRSVVDIREPILPVRSLVFDCDEFTLTRLYDPRFLQGLHEIEPLDARRGAAPQRFDLLLADEMLAGFVEPGTRLNLLLRYGQVGNRIALLNMPPAASSDEKLAPSDSIRSNAGQLRAQGARGYTTGGLNQLGSLPLATAKDFYRLDDRRLRDYRRAGVSSARVDDLHASAKRQIEAADRALRADDGAALIRSATGAWASEARVYDAAQAMARDVIRAAILLLILCVPFSFCMERLLIATPNIYRQIAGGCCIFAVMTLALWSFHPAFRISSSPLIVILAFAIILMSCIVIAVVYAKFDTELTRLRSGQGGPSTASAPGGTTARGAAGGIASAVMIGLASMRRRKFRTALTSITIVLVTFALLSFTSTTRYVGTRTYPTGARTSHPGIELRQRGFRPMPAILVDQLRADLGDPKLKLSHPANIVEQWWAVSTIEPNEQYNLVSSNHVVSIPAVLGLSPGASQISSIAETIGQRQFARLEHGDQNIIYLSRNLAGRLDVHENSVVRLGGIDLTVAGVFDAARYDRQVRNLSGDRLAPLKYTAGQLDAGGRSLDDTSAGSLDLSGSAEASTSYEFLSADDFAIVPARLCRTLYKSALRSVSIPLDDQQQVKVVSDQLARRFSLALFAGYDDGVRMVAAGNLSKVNGSGAVIVPLAVAALIIFNTMLGSIAERKREIHIYTSLGLAPLHVGALFVAEALVYGLLGTVFGYIIGQGTAMLLQHLGWLGTVTLNFSGTSAILTMGLVLLIVLLSSLVPARVASKIASPSIDRTWKVPRPQGDLIRASLPFTIDQRAADGALAYLAEFFEAHREGAIGKFAAGAVLPVNGESPPAGPDESSHEPLEPQADQSFRGLTVPIWLTPFDLGVRQQLTLRVHPSEIPDIYEVDVLLKRLRGDDRNWHRMNRTFLTELRRQFLQWRSLTPQRMQEYIDQSRQRFAAPEHAEPQEAIT